jgi:hypothetical protein
METNASDERGAFRARFRERALVDDRTLRVIRPEPTDGLQMDGASGGRRGLRRPKPRPASVFPPGERRPGGADRRGAL